MHLLIVAGSIMNSPSRMKLILTERHSDKYLEKKRDTQINV